MRARGLRLRFLVLTNGVGPGARGLRLRPSTSGYLSHFRRRRGPLSSIPMARHPGDSEPVDYLTSDTLRAFSGGCPPIPSPSYPGSAPPSTSGLGHGPFKAVARVRIPPGAKEPTTRPCGRPWHRLPRTSVRGRVVRTEAPARSPRTNGLPLSGRSGRSSSSAIERHLRLAQLRTRVEPGWTVALAAKALGVAG
jgi:hypothetical protein